MRETFQNELSIRHTWATAAPCTTECVAQALPPVGVFRQVGRCAALICVLGLVLLSTRRTARCSARLVLHALGIRLVAPPGLPAGELLAVNHISWLDPVTLLAIGPAVFLAKREVRDWPLIGPVTRRTGTRYIPRSGVTSLPAVIGELADDLRHGHTAVVFPAGTTSCGPPGGPFHRAVFQAALCTGTPIRPVTIAYEQAGEPSTAAAFVGTGTLISSLRQVLRARDLTVRVNLLEPVAYDPLTPPRVARRKVVDAAYEAIVKACG